jgi:hypothetical protein
MNLDTLKQEMTKVSDNLCSVVSEIHKTIIIVNY